MDRAARLSLAPCRLDCSASVPLMSSPPSNWPCSTQPGRFRLCAEAEAKASRCATASPWRWQSPKRKRGQNSALRRPGQGPFPDHHIEPGSAALFRPGHGLRVRLSIMPPRLPRSRKRSGSTPAAPCAGGAISRLWAQYQRAADARRQCSGAKVHRRGSTACGKCHSARERADHGAGQALFGRSKRKARRSRRRLCRRDADRRPLLSPA